MSKWDIWGRNGRTVTVLSKQEPPIQNKRVQKYDPAFLHLQHTKQFVLRPHLASSRHIWLLLRFSYIWENHHPTQYCFGLVEDGVGFVFGTSYCFVK